MLLSFTNSLGQTFNINGNYLLASNWELGNAPVNHQSSKAPYQDGETYIDTIFESGNPILEFTIIGDNRQQIFDRRLIVQQHFNPKLGIGTLKWVQENGTTYCLDCIPSKPVFVTGEGQSRGHQAVIISLFAPNPSWYNPTQYERHLVGFSGGWSFPWSFPLNFGTVSQQITVRNSGNVDTPILVYFAGEIHDPEIENLTTGKKISVVKNIDDGKTLIINTTFGKKSVQILDGGLTNAFEYVDLDSVFWQLVPGDNEIRYVASFEGANSLCKLLYYNRFSGV